MAKYMWLRIPANGFLEDDIVFYGNGKTDKVPGGEVEEKKSEDLDLIESFIESNKKKQVKFESLIICHTYSSPGCVWVKRSSGWVKVCDS
jgi:hypothetical protein